MRSELLKDVDHDSLNKFFTEFIVLILLGLSEGFSNGLFVHFFSFFLSIDLRLNVSCKLLDVVLSKES